ncbi:MAG: hypothetical protein A3F68_08230 [Acidobacteria bacterium RIFCSPLOWO2_12_FULL_54_10]|nr:MAG: hypothetical protein A3F68_08230 [Acidobacteria bacterium RIFCSPLOWO2_12_FULL_54_10]
MLCRTSKLIHPASGASLETPLLVPSFSSKAFGFGRDGKSEVLQVLEVAQEFITRTCLVSAYDVHYAYIPEPQDLSITVDLMFLDSGGYEVSDDRDLSAVEKPVHRPGDWDAAKLQAIWDRWPAGLPAVLVSYDHSNHRRSVTEQLRDAKDAMLARPSHLHSFLLKPQAKEERSLDSALRALGGQVGELAGFQLLGVTEKELGNSPLERMVRIARLRQALDAAALSIPIHVFGALDPLSVCLYFVAGAEVFDGLTWSRYAYRSGQCIYVHNSAAMAYGIDVDDDEARVRTIKDNLRHLDQLERSLRLFSETRDWNQLAESRDLVQGAVDQLRSQLERSH